MAKKTAGIDLGTTNSCIAVPSDDQSLGNVKVVTDRRGRGTVPSVVAVGSDGEIIVGHRAKQRMGTLPAPVAFIKRYMGTDHRTKLGDEEKTPEEISAIILQHLVASAEAEFGDDIKDVVITHPVRFSEAAIEATRQAADKAGLRVAALMSEPMAAAVAYGLQDREEDLTIFCYDLGGGTFDATLLRKGGEGGIKVVKSGGIPDLGGYNFDKALAKHILAELVDKGYDLDLRLADLEANPEDALRFQKLMWVAERVKVELSRPDIVEYELLEQALFVDHSGEPVSVDLTISREDFEELIREDVESTIKISQAVLATSKLDAFGVGRVIMVGGSSNIPLIQERLREALGREPELVDPEKVVARGAAMKAGSLSGHTVAGIEFIGRLPKRHALDTFSLRVKVTADPVAEQPVRVERDDGYAETGVTNDHGECSIPEIELIPEEENYFTLTAGKADPYQFSVIQDPEREDRTIQTDPFITEDIKLILASRDLVVFKEGTEIPTTVTLDSLGTAVANETHIRFEGLHGNHSLGTVVLKDLPEGLPKGSPIEMTIGIDEKRVISGSAKLVATRAEVEFAWEIPKAKLPTFDGSQLRLAELKEQFQIGMANVTDKTEQAEFFGEGNGLVQALEKALADPPYEFNTIYRLLDEFTQFNRRLARVNILEPPLSEFEDNLDEAGALAGAFAESKPDKAARARYPEQIDAIESTGRDALVAKNKDVWAGVNKQLESLMEEMRPDIDIPPELLAEFLRGRSGKLINAIQARIEADVAQADASGMRARFTVFEAPLQGLIAEYNAIPWAEGASVISRAFRLKSELDELDKETAGIGGLPEGQDGG